MSLARPVVRLADDSMSLANVSKVSNLMVLYTCRTLDRNL